MECAQVECYAVRRGAFCAPCSVGPWLPTPWSVIPITHKD